MTRSNARRADAPQTVTVYNSTDGPLPYDRAGRVVGARESVEVTDPTAFPIGGHVAAGRFVVIDQTDESTDDGPAAGGELSPTQEA